MSFSGMVQKRRKTPFAPSLSVTILSSEVSQISTFPKFMEELIMPFKRAQVPSQREILSLAEDWGKVVRAAPLATRDRTWTSTSTPSKRLPSRQLKPSSREPSSNP